MITPTKQRSLFLREWRARAGLTTNELAEKAGTTAAYISRVETRHTNPSLSFLEACAKAMGITVADLVAGPPKKEASHG